jgi:anhydro-N-acetylmuramic acid kinase
MMSGTSADGIEAVLCEVDGAPPEIRVSVLAGLSSPFAPELQRRIHLAARADTSDVESICLLDVELGERFAGAALELIDTGGLEPTDIDVIGSPGQTVWHAVREDGTVAGTLQLGKAAVIAERTGITTISDFRSRDIAAGGNGAPLVGYVDWLLLRHPTEWRAAQNIGGIANVTFLPPLDEPDAAPVAFDTGPGNVLVDCLAQTVSGGARRFDLDGELAAAGTVDASWLAELLGHPYFARMPPKTTGRELFSPQFAAQLLETGRSRGLSEPDVVATATELTAVSIADAYRRFAPEPPAEVVASGGGTRNPILMARLAEALPQASVITIDQLGIASHQKEAVALAVLAHETWHGRPGTLPGLTGARRAVVLGQVTPGHRGTAP